MERSPVSKGQTEGHLSPAADDLLDTGWVSIGGSHPRAIRPAQLSAQTGGRG